MLDEESRRRDFPSLGGMTYLNTAAEGIPPVCVRTALDEYFRDRQLGAEGRPRHAARHERARALGAGLFGMRPEEIGICSCTSEAFNLLALALGLRLGDEVVVNDLDFPSGRTPWRHFVGDGVREWSHRGGALDPADLDGLLTPRTRLIVTSLVSYYNGYVVDLPSLVDSVRRRSPAVIAVDVTQALGRIPLRLSGVDFVISSTHKWICGPHGGGLVGIPAGAAERLGPPAGGWFNFEDPFSASPPDSSPRRTGALGYQVGMPSYAAIYGIAAALEYVTEVGVERIESACRPLVEACLTGLKRLPVEMLTPGGGALAGILAFRRSGMAEIHARLSSAGIQVMHSSGRLRVAIHGYNTMEDIRRLLDELGAAT